MTLTYKELEIELALEGLLEVEEFRLTLGLNQHAYLFMKLLVQEEYADNFVNLASVLPVIIREMEVTQGKIIFQGKLETVSIQKEQGIWYLQVDAFSYTKDWERTEKSRSFLNGGNTYLDVARKVLSDYGRADIIDEISGGAKIPEMLLQYEESDWVFLRRLCSHFGGYLMADITDSCGKVYFGTPDHRYGTKLDKQDYTLKKDLLHYAHVLEPQGILPQEVTNWRICSRFYLRMWETLLFNGVEAVVTAMNLHTENGELVYEYELSRKGGLKRAKERNPRIFGMSIPATVKERSGNRVRVKFDIDQAYEESPLAKYFTYAIESSSIYCMPEVGSRVHIYFPEHDEQSAVAVHAIRSAEAGAGGSGQNPENKRFSDPSGNAMDMTPDNMDFAPDSSGATALHLDKGGFVSLKGTDITIKSRMGVETGEKEPVQSLMICGEQKMTLQIGDSSDDSIILESGADVQSALVKQDADSAPQAQPAPEEILAQIGADDEQNRMAENDAVKQDMIQKKQESKSKFLNGVVSLVTVVGLTALTVATGGATAPLLIAAGVKATFAAADIAEGLDGYSKMNAMDASRPANFLRDTIFMGNETAYNIGSMLSDIVFDVVSGKALLKASKGGKFLTKLQQIKGKAGKFWDGICKRTRVANFVAQMGGTMISGMVNDYLTTGNIDIKNLGIDAVAGTIKGTLGTGAAEWGKSLFKTDSKAISKLIGTGFGAAFGTGVDVVADLFAGREIDLVQTFKENLIESGLGQMFGEPIDVATGAFLITATDFMAADIQGTVRVQRKYNSTNTKEGILGQGWKFTYEGRIYQDGNRFHAALCDGYTAVFEWDGEQAVNVTPGCGWYGMEKQENAWVIRDLRKHLTHHFNSAGMLEAVEDRNGQKIRLSYRGGALDAIVTPLGDRLQAAMRDGRLVQLKDSLGRTMQYRYENGLLSDVVHMDQGITHYEYDSRGFLVRAVDQAKVTYLCNEYDGNGRVILQTLANGDTYKAEYCREKRTVRVTGSIGNKTVLYTCGRKGEILSAEYGDGSRQSYAYDGAGNRIGSTDRLGNETRWKYDAVGRMVEETKPGGLVTARQYDENGNLALEWDNAGHRTERLYDDRHNVVSVREQAGTGKPDRVMNYSYDRLGRLIGETDARGGQTSYRYEPGCAGPSAIRYADGEERHFSYDRAGRLMAEEDECGRTEYGYNARNKCTLVRDGEGNESRWLYDGMGRLLAMYPPKAWKEKKGEYSYAYDFLDRLTDTINPDGSHERQMRDGEGRILKKVHPNAYDAALDDGEGITYDYDSDGNNIRIHYPDGGCGRMFYDAGGNLVRHVLPEAYDAALDDGEGWNYTYDMENRLKTVTGPDGALLFSAEYDLMGNLTAETDAMGRTAYRKHTLDGQLQELLEPADERDGEILYRRTAYEYDLNGNMVREQRCGGYWDRNGNLIMADGADLVLQFTYDKRNRRIRAEDGTGAVISCRYDVQGKPVYEERLVSEDVKQVLHYEYDRAGRLTKIKEELDSGLPETAGDHKYAVTTYRYDGNGNRTEIITPEGYRIFREYDSRDRLASERVLDKSNGIDRTAEISYDNAGNITKITQRGKGQDAWELRYGYDLKDRITHAEDCLGPVFQYAYDKNDRLAEEILPQAFGKMSYERRCLYAYNAYGEMLSMKDGAGTIQKENRYLPDGKLSLTRNADGNETEYIYGISGMASEIRTARSRKAGLPAQQYTYDSRGRITGLVNGNGNTTGYDVDSWGRVRGVHNADGGKEGYAYDFAGNITSTEDAGGGVITYRYNSRGKVCEIIDQEGHSETFRYDREGRMTLHTDRNGNWVRTSYNVDGNPVIETGTDRNGENAVTRSWEYDAGGRVRKAVSGGFCYTYEYRADGRLARKSSSGRTLVSCTYFPDGSLESLTDAGGKPVCYEYDWRGKLSVVKDGNGNTLAQYAHTPGGRLKEIRHGNGMHTLYEYDTDGNIIRLRLERPDGTPLADWRYEYDLNGNRTLKAGSFADAEDRLRGTVIRYRYDKRDRLTWESHDGDAAGYSYDLCGNRIKKVDKNGQEVYTYNVKNQLICRKSKMAETFYRYDQQGNVLEATGTEGGTYYSYNAFNQLTKVRKSDGSYLESRYDAEYLRAKTAENGRTANFLYYNGELLAELNHEQEVTSQYVLGYGVAAGWNHKNEGFHFYHQDEQLSTAYITGMDVGIENRYQYDAFGSIRDHQEKIPNRILYTGQQYDHATEQYYLRARYYNPAVGRFQQEDVYRGDGLNLYAYCRNNPVIYYDPSGYSTLQEILEALQTNKGIDGKRNIKYVLNESYNDAIKSKENAQGYYLGRLQAHHGLQKEWAEKNLKKFGYDAGLAPTITLETNGCDFTKDKGFWLTHTNISAQQIEYNARNGYTDKLEDRLILGAKQQMNAGLSKEVVMKDLENNYRMIDKLKRENTGKFSSTELKELDYSRTKINNELDQYEQELTAGNCKEK